MAGIMHKVEDTLGGKKKDEQTQGQQHKTGGLPGGQHQAGEFQGQGVHPGNQNQGHAGHGLQGDQCQGQGGRGGLQGDQCQGQGGRGGLQGDQCQGQGGRGGLQGGQRQGEGKEGIAGKIKDKIHGGQGQDGNKKKDGRDSCESD